MLLMNRVMGLDLGYNQAKISTPVNKYVFPSVIGNPGIAELEQLDTVDLIDSMQVVIGEEVYYVGKKASETKNARLCVDRDKTNSIHEKVIYNTILGLASEDYDNYEESITVVTGLPIRDFKNAQQKEHLIRCLNGEHNIIFNGKEILVNVDDVLIIPQAAGAYFDYVLNEDGTFNKAVATIAQGRVIVIDIGYRTTDVVTLTNGRYDSKYSFSIDSGMLEIHTELVDLIDFHHKKIMDITEMDDVCRKGFISKLGRQINIANLIKIAIEPVFQAILSGITTRIKDESIADKILGTGGTITLLGDSFAKHYGELYTTMKNPELANASGYAKYGVFKLNANKLQSKRKQG